MSLINQMLRDLEQRKPSSPVTPNKQPLKVQSPVNQPQIRHHQRWWLLAIVLGIGAFLWVQSTDHPPIQAPTPATQPVKQSQSLNTPVVAEIAAPAPSTQSVASETGAASKPTESTSTTPAPSFLSNPTTPDAHPAPISASIVKTETAASPKSTKNPVNTEIAAKPSNANTLRGTSQRAETLYRQASESASRMMRKATLREALELNPRHLPARNLLLETLMQEKSSLELKQFLDESLGLFPDNPGFITALAHWHIKQKNFAAATKTLEQINSYSNHDPQYLALLAASYQQQQNFSQALTIYQKLSHLQPDKAENWLGLAICADKLQQSNNAIQAYQQALGKNTLNGDVVDYIQQRLSALKR